LRGKIAIEAAITQVQNVFKGVLNLEPEIHADGSQFDHLLQDDEVVAIDASAAKPSVRLGGHASRAVSAHASAR
jgi:serine/threonine-protein kinase RIO1